MKRLIKRPVVLVLLLVSSVLIGIGGKTYMDLREEKKAQELLLAEKESVQELKKKFANIAEVKIEKANYDTRTLTGSYFMFVTMTNTKGQSVSFSYDFGKTSREIGGYGINDRSVQVKGTTTTKVKVIYSNGTEDYV